MRRNPAPPDGSFGARLRDLREEAGLTYYALGKASGVDQRLVARLERGQHEPSLDTARKLWAALGASLADFDPPADVANVAYRESRGGLDDGGEGR